MQDNNHNSQEENSIGSANGPSKLEFIKSLNLQPIADVANNLINKISGAIGWIVTRVDPVDTATNNFINDISKSNLDPLNKAILIANARKVLKERSNQENVIKIALDNLKESAKPDLVEDDWLAQYFEKTRLISDVEFQHIWGKILAEECNEPQSVPRSLLHILEQMDKRDAEAFTNICRYVVTLRSEKDVSVSYLPIIIHEKLKEDYEGLSYDALINLESIGLIKMGDISFYMNLSGNGEEAEKERIENTDQKVVKNRYFACYGKDEYSIPTDDKYLFFGMVAFTKPGIALCKAIEVEFVPGFLQEKCIPFWSKAKDLYKDMVL